MLNVQQVRFRFISARLLTSVPSISKGLRKGCSYCVVLPKAYILVRFMEDRLITIGKVDKILFVVYTERVDKTRIISARPATKAERRLYGNSYIGFVW